MNYLIIIKSILSQAQQKAYVALNSVMEEAYWNIRQFCTYFPDYQILKTLFSQLPWSHFQPVLKVSNEKALIDNLHEFILKLSKGFAFVARQEHIRSETDSLIAKYYISQNNKQVFASKYMTFLPTEEELVQEIKQKFFFIKINLH